MELPSEIEIQRIVKIALAEDIGTGDVTTLATVPENVPPLRRWLRANRWSFADWTLRKKRFLRFLQSFSLKKFPQMESASRKGGTLLEIKGEARAILTAERVALNFVQRLSGVATLTAQFVEAVKGRAQKFWIRAKRRRVCVCLEKYAVACGGGQNHRIGLFDMVLIKDNHLVALRNEPPNAIEAAVRRAREKFPKIKVEVEADTPEQVEQALFAGADVILLDNMSLEEMRTAVFWVNGRAKLEASGGVNLQTVRAIAETGVDFISVGALTHSARAVDIALDFEF